MFSAVRVVAVVCRIALPTAALAQPSIMAQEKRATPAKPQAKPAATPAKPQAKPAAAPAKPTAPAVAFIESAPLSDEERAQVAHRNAERIFRIAA